MIQAPHSLFPVTDRSDVGAARREVAGIADRIGATAALGDAAQLAATELGTNIVRHAGGDGYLLVRPLETPASAIEILAVDRGPGFIARSPLRSAPAPATPPFEGGGLGVGLSSVERLASEFDLWSERGQGSVVLARFRTSPLNAPSAVLTGGVSLPVVPSDVNGDGWAALVKDSWAAAVVVDGLGHGPAAHEAAQAALCTFPGALADGDARTWLKQAHWAMRPTRGGVIGLVLIDLASRTVEFAGVGNVSGRLMNFDYPEGGCAHQAGRANHLVSRPGTAGAEHRPPEPGVTSLPWPPGAVLVLWSDGIKTPGDWSRSARLFCHDPSVAAAALHSQWSRGRDDATVVVIKDPGEPGE